MAFVDDPLGGIKDPRQRDCRRRQGGRRLGGERGGRLVEGLKQIANWAADKVRDLVNGLLAAGHALGDIVSDALQASFDALKKILQGIIDAGKAL